MPATSQKFKLGSTERELDLVPSRVPHEPPFIYVDDVLEAFKIPDAERFEAGGRTIAYVRDDSGKKYLPNRIPCRPDCIIQVVYEKPQSDSTSLKLKMAPGTTESLNESIDQLSIQINASKDLDLSEPMGTTRSRCITTHIHSQLQTLNAAVKLVNHSGRPLDIKAMQHLIGKHLVPSSNVQDIQQYLVENVDALVRDVGELKLQGNVLEQLACKMINMQQQALDRLTLIQSKTEAILMQQLELAEYPIPRLFIVLPEEPAKYDPDNWFRTKFRLHFICEGGKHTEASNSKLPHHLHLGKHEGYPVRAPTEFFKKYGPFLLLMLELIKVGKSIAGHVVPTLASLKVVELTDSVKLSVESVMAKINYSLECINKQLAKAQALSPGDCIDTELQAAMTQQDLAKYLSNVKGLEGAELHQLGSFLRTSEEENPLGNLFRITTSDGHIKWICHDHYRASNQEKHTQNLHDVVKLAHGEFDEQLGRIAIPLDSSFAATEFYNAVIKARSVLELTVELRWQCSKSDFEVMEETLKKSRVSILHLDLQLLRPIKLLSTTAQYGALFRIMSLPHLNTIHIVLPTDFIKLVTFQPKKPSNNCKLSFELIARSVRGKDFLKLVEALKTSTTLTTLNLQSNSIGENRAQAVAEALKTNSVLTSLNLVGNSIGDKGAQALAQALKNNSTLTTLDLRGYSIGKNGAQALAEALKTNSTLTTLNLGRNSIGDDGAQALAQALKTNSTLTTLHLWSSSTGDNGAQALALALQTNANLTTLDLRDCSIGDNGAQVLAEALKTNSTLTTLNLMSNSIGDNGAQALAEALKVSLTLTTLNLLGNKGKTAGALSEALYINSSLAILR